MVEKSLRGKVTYSAGESHESPLNEGTVFPDMQLLDIYTARRIQLSELINRTALITYFSSNCGCIKETRRLETINDLAQNLKKASDSTLVLGIFAAKYSPEELKDRIQSGQISFPVYSSFDVPDTRAAYWTRPAQKLDPLTLLLDTKRRIIFAERPSMEENEVCDGVLAALANIQGNLNPSGRHEPH